MIKIWGRITSINVRKVVWAARELGLEFDRIDVGGAFGGLDTPEYIGMNPNSKIPTLDDNGYILSESNAIVRYLAAQYGSGSLWPDDTRKRGEADRWMDWQATEFGPASTPVFWQLIRTPEDKRDPKVIADSIAACARLGRILDHALEGRKHVAGDTFTMADIIVGCVADRWLNLPIDRPDTPNVRRWFDTLAARPAAQGILNQPLV
ncbi:glutathione S-transferase [Pigmentiphaga litoralis]|jgi:glutathione S-transferase|uniref:glutathione S-transferase family protein n=1 Tax=Pigmentiphaga litoralis TaxID=516702 RepID=UPI0016724A36|nr:glutathione S-transferase [Pigmentiphaga litoralis]GGX22222.1 glutathione S-transferase [Pigmentiphaga litoralis]